MSQYYFQIIFNINKCIFIKFIFGIKEYHDIIVYIKFLTT